jgi:hypothetical protein
LQVVVKVFGDAGQKRLHLPARMCAQRHRRAGCRSRTFGAKTRPRLAALQPPLLHAPHSTTAQLQCVLCREWRAARSLPNNRPIAHTHSLLSLSACTTAARSLSASANSWPLGMLAPCCAWWWPCTHALCVCVRVRARVCCVCRVRDEHETPSCGAQASHAGRGGSASVCTQLRSAAATARVPVAVTAQQHRTAHRSSAAPGMGAQHGWQSLAQHTPRCPPPPNAPPPPPPSTHAHTRTHTQPRMRG